MNRAAILVLACATVAAAQEKLTVPLSDPSRPATVKAHLINGSITVTAGGSGQVVVDSQHGHIRGRADRRVPPGMHRLDTGDFEPEIEEDHNTVTINTGPFAEHGDLVIQVPVNTSLELRTISGGRIDVTGISGDLDIQNTNGSVVLTNVSGSVVAHSLNGGITASLDRVSPDKPMAFTSLNGKIDVTLPADTKARLRLKTNNGSVYTDFDVKMEPDSSKPVVEDARGKGGKYRIRMDRGIYGSINGGGPEYSFQTLNGEILIHRK
jgi:hypothetical protein